MHEELSQELEAQYEVNRSIYEQIEIWNQLFVEYQEFEVKFRLFFFLFVFLYFLILEKCQ